MAEFTGFSFLQSITVSASLSRDAATIAADVDIDVSNTEDEPKETEDEENERILKESDEIASKLMKLLFDQFVQKEGREPTDEEFDQLKEELTPDRLEQLLNGIDEEASDEEEDSDTWDRKEEKESEPAADTTADTTADKNIDVEDVGAENTHIVKRAKI